MSLQVNCLKLDFKTRADASAAVADLVYAALAEAVIDRGKASIAVSGGGTPGTALSLLSNKPLSWDRISVGLVDERFVPPDHYASNEGLTRKTLLINKALNAQLLPMWTGDGDPLNAAARADRRYRAIKCFDFVLLGMGSDGHTASWFPGSKNLAHALNENDRSVIAANAAGCPGAGTITQRLTLTRSAIANSRRCVLLMFGTQKNDLFESALTNPIAKHPIRAAVEALEDRLIVVWAP